MEKVTAILKSKKFWIAVGLLVLISITYGVGGSGAKIALGETKVGHDELVSKIEELEKEQGVAEQELEDIKAEIDETKTAFNNEESRLDEKRKEVDETLALIDDRDQLADEIKELEDNLKSNQSTLDTLTTNIEGKEAQLEKLENAIVQKKEDPVELLSGVYVVGSDVAAGRYQVTNIGRGTNFFVYSSSGSNKVNTILGDSSIGSGDYVFFANDGDVIETNGKVKLIPVEE
ncbi:hypothetical protein CIL05_14600 [Virgibacillus profundi]|uniref:Uncharacterized protein n=1 Tax=Virgibacillus profundi TaxID=2024555 RepID=A0A2A2ICQ1_9BACI|nr:hypothetical protein [Virgibacillus profundi]PAV28853.1 hypothetical protein CIL05_14600 [Virgibacillus profundi]PXY53021.1 hypothetical protein CIT14_14725 [Virgibacillus profundi]